MNAPSILFLFDSTALLAGKMRDWQEFSRLGECYLPQVIVEEIRFLSNRAPDPSQELTAREFIRFYHNSGWHITNAHAEHPALKPTPGSSMSQRARLALSVSYSAFGMSLEHPGGLVVLVANEQPLLQRVQGLNVRNLCGISVSNLLEWARYNRQPITVAQRLRALETGRNFVAQNTQPKATSRGTTSSVTTSTKAKSASKSKANRSSDAPKIETYSYGDEIDLQIVPQIMASVSAVVALVIAGFLFWGLNDPNGMNKWLDDRGLPTINIPR